MSQTSPSPLSRSQSQALLNDAGRAYGAGQPWHAYQLAMQLVTTEPDHKEAHFVAGLAANAAQRPDLAVAPLKQACELDPQRAEYVAALARALEETHQLGDALWAANRSLELGLSEPVMLGNLGSVYLRVNAHERALSVFRKAAQLTPAHFRARFNLALSLTFTGDITAAERELETCLRLHPQFWHGHAMLSHVRKQTAERNHIERLERLAQSSGLPADGTFHLHAALGKEYEDLGDHRKAFDHLSRGKAAIHGTLRYDPGRMRSLVDALVALPDKQANIQGCRSGEPIFIVGMPRTGTTLVERIISSHPEVYAAGELENFGLSLKKLAGVSPASSLDPTWMETADAVDRAALGSQYLASTRPMTALKPRFIDKLPHNFLYLGWIAEALPHARIICLRRDPMDTCLSNFREPFNPGSPNHQYAFDLHDIGDYYIQFDRLMAHWKSRYPERILEIDYEAIVSEQEASSRRLLAHCDLPWNDRCLHFERNTAASATASSTQVRSPIYATSVKRWRRYAELLEPLRQQLESAGIAIAR